MVKSVWRNLAACSCTASVTRGFAWPTFRHRMVAVPDGLLRASGIDPPLAVSHELWSLFTNLIDFFVIESAYRRHRFPRQPYRNMFDFLRRMAAAMPRIRRLQ